MKKDTLERAREPNLDLKSYLRDTYTHPVFKEEVDDENIDIESQESELVATKRQSRINTPAPSKISGGSSPLLPEYVSEDVASPR